MACFFGHVLWYSVTSPFLLLAVNFTYLMQLFQVLGTPTREEIKCMNPNYTEFKFPQIKAHPWHKVQGAENVRLSTIATLP